MSRYSNVLSDVFASYGDDAKSALAAYANIDPEGSWAYAEAAAEKQYHLDYGAWRRSQIRTSSKDILSGAQGQVRLFEPPDSDAVVMFRSRLVLDGTEHDLADIHGHDGASLIRKVAERDLAPALTTINRCKLLLRLADHLDIETERLDRDVSAGEVLGWGEAA